MWRAFIIIDEFPCFEYDSYSAWQTIKFNSNRTGCQTTDVNNDGRTVCTDRCSLAGGPPHCASTQDMEMDVVDRLTSVLSIVDDNPVAFGQARLLSTLLCDYHQVAQQLRDERENWWLTLRWKHARVDKVSGDSNWSRRALHLVVAERKLVLTKIILTAASPSSACDSWTIGFFGTTRMWVGAWGEISGKATHWNNKWTKRRRKGFYF